MNSDSDRTDPTTGDARLRGCTYHDRQHNIPISCDFWQRLRKLVNRIVDKREQTDEETGATGEHLEDFLQAFTHLVLISATDILDRTPGRGPDKKCSGGME